MANHQVAHSKEESRYGVGPRDPDVAFITDAKGNRTGVVLDLQTYEHLRKAEEELADIQAYDSTRARAHSEIAAGQFSTWLPIALVADARRNEIQIILPNRFKRN